MERNQTIKPQKSCSLYINLLILCDVGFIVKEENDNDSNDSEAVVAYLSCGKCGKMYLTTVTLAKHIMQHEEEDEAIDDDGKEQNNDSDKDTDVAMSTETQEVPEKMYD